MTIKTLKVLICDDSLLIRKKLKEILRQIGNFEILEASNGLIALDIYKGFRPDLVFMDIVMPEKDGIEALKEIKKFDRGAKVIMLSSSGTQSHLKKTLEAGAIDFIQKPWEKSQIISAIARVVKEREGE